MNRIYNKQEIAHMLDKFMAGETSLNEEQMLAEYFRTNEVGDEWLEYKEMFALFDSGKVDIEQEKEVTRQHKTKDNLQMDDDWHCGKHPILDRFLHLQKRRKVRGTECDGGASEQACRCRERDIASVAYHRGTTNAIHRSGAEFIKRPEARQATRRVDHYV